MPEQKKARIVHIDALRDEIAGPIEVNGKQYDVRQITFGTHQRLNAGGDGDDFSTIKQAVRDVAPTLPDEEIDRLNLQQAKAILILSGAGVAAVEAMFPNAIGGPETPISPD